MQGSNHEGERQMLLDRVKTDVAPATPIKRGELVLAGHRHSSTALHGETTFQVEWRVHTVESVSRDGWVRKLSGERGLRAGRIVARCFVLREQSLSRKLGRTVSLTAVLARIASPVWDSVDEALRDMLEAAEAS